jgi:hypothetical protein
MHIHRRVLAYCNTEREAMRFAGVAAQAGLLADTIFGSTPMRRRAELLEQFVDGRARVLVSVGTLCEGVDIRAADTCVFVEARSSRINVWQCIGRVMRVHEGKQWGWIILPTTAEGVELRRFADIVRVHDPSAFEGGRPGKRIEQVYAEWRADEEFSGTCEHESLEAALMGEWWQKLSWLHEYVAAEKGLPTAKTVWTRPNGSEWKIGSWVSMHRHAYKKGKLPEDQARQLETVSGWIWEDESRKNVAARRPWSMWLEALRECVTAEKGLPKRSTVWTRPDGSKWKIGPWTKVQRRERKKGKLLEDRARQLEAVPGWIWEDEARKNIAAAQPWPAWLEVLREYVAAEEGLPKITTGWTRPDGSEWKIGQWINAQRQARKKGKLPEDQVRQLEAVPGWIWEDEKMKNTAAKQPWLAWLEVLHEHVATEGSIPKQSSVWTRPDGSSWNIGAWTDAQRQACKKGKLSEDRIRQLEVVPGWFWKDKDTWPVWLEVLREHVAAEESLPKQSTVWTRPDGSEWRIGAWISKQRTVCKKGKLPEDRVRQLEAVPGWIWEDESKKNAAAKQPWPAWLEVLRECVATEEGLPKQSTVWTRPDGSKWKIGIWISKERQARKKGKLPEDRARQLEAVPGWKW